MGRKRKEKYDEFDDMDNVTDIDNVIDNVDVDEASPDKLSYVMESYLTDYDYPVNSINDEVVLTLNDMVEDVKTKQAVEVVVPVGGKISENKVVVDYEGYGLVVDVKNANVDKVTLRVYGVLGQADFSYEVV